MFPNHISEPRAILDNCSLWALSVFFLILCTFPYTWTAIARDDANEALPAEKLWRRPRQATSEQSKSQWITPSGSQTREVLDFTKSFHVGQSCSDVQLTQGATRSGVYLIHPQNLVQGPWRVFCDMENDGGGWTVFQVRDDVTPHENFQRNWEDYKVGFGNFDREFWLGNILIWALTTSDNATQQELHIELEDWSGNKRFARYPGFRIGSEEQSFKLMHDNFYIGNAGDSLHSHRGRPFSIFDIDNDGRDGENLKEKNCARLYKGGWWYGNCHDCNLNGLYLKGHHNSFADGINWYTWTGYNYSLKKTVMKFKPRSKEPLRVGLDSLIISNRAHVSRNEQQRLADPSAYLMSSTNRLTKPAVNEL